MQFILVNNTICDANQQNLAKIYLTPKSDKVFSIDRVWVDESLRGQGIAGQLMVYLYELFTQNGWQAIPICPYAISWFAKNPDKQDILG